MSTTTDANDAFATVGPDVPDYDRYDIVTDDEEVLLYATDEDEAWIRSDDYIDLGLMI